MNQIWADNGLIEGLTDITNRTHRYRLYTNDFTPTRDTLVGDLTEQVGDGYATFDLVDSTAWVLSVNVHQGIAIATPKNFGVAVAPWTIFGIYVTNVAGTVLYFAMRLDGAPITVAIGDSLTHVPIISIFSQAT